MCPYLLAIYNIVCPYRLAIDFKQVTHGNESKARHGGMSISRQDYWLLGDSGGVVNSLDFCPASLKSLGCFLLPVGTFFTMEGGDSEFANFTLPTLKAFLEARSHNVSGNKQ